MTAQQVQVVLNWYEPCQTGHLFEWWGAYFPALEGREYLPALLFNRLSSGELAIASRRYKSRAAAFADLANAVRPLYFEVVAPPLLGPD